MSFDFFVITIKRIWIPDLSHRKRIRANKAKYITKLLLVIQIMNVINGLLKVQINNVDPPSFEPKFNIYRI